MIDESTLRRIVREVIREELDNYDRDKGKTPRVNESGAPIWQPNYAPAPSPIYTPPTPAFDCNCAPNIGCMNSACPRRPRIA